MSASDQPIVHTPGPWEMREVEGLFAIAHPHGWVLESDNEQQDRADARLISAAPDLLEACKRYLDAMDRYGHPDKTDRLMIAAIEKATGEKVV